MLQSCGRLSQHIDRRQVALLAPETGIFEKKAEKKKKSRSLFQIFSAFELARSIFLTNSSGVPNSLYFDVYST